MLAGGGLAGALDDAFGAGCAVAGGLAGAVGFAVELGSVLDGGGLFDWVCASAGAASNAAQAPTPTSQDAFLTMDSSGNVANVRVHHTPSNAETTESDPSSALFFRPAFL